MNIDNFDKAQREADEYDENVDETPIDPHDTAHWAFGAPVPGGLVNSRLVEDANRGSPAFRNFDFRLRIFFSEAYPKENIRYEDTILVRFIFI